MDSVPGPWVVAGGLAILWMLMASLVGWMVGVVLRWGRGEEEEDDELPW